MCKYFINNCTNSGYLYTPPVDFGIFGLIFVKNAQIRSKKCTKYALRNVDNFIAITLFFFAILCN